MPTVVTQFEHHVQEEEDIDDVIKDPEPEGQVPDSITAHNPKKNIRKSAHFSDIVVAYTLPVEVVKESVPSTFREADLRFESEL